MPARAPHAAPAEGAPTTEEHLAAEVARLTEALELLAQQAALASLSLSAVPLPAVRQVAQSQLTALAALATGSIRRHP